ncbi:DUF4402 domain-containing protein [Candidatus Woesearchaeota archaeon]|nr:DUF4402 domain-containing protein [Candidatus Woesearchaeota archaeon]
MANKTVVTILMILILAISALGVLAVGTVNVVESSVNLTGNHNSGVQGSFNVENTGSTNLTGVLLTSTNLVSGTQTISSTSVQINPASMNLNAGQSSLAVVTVNVPNLQFAGTYTGALTAKFDDSNQDSAVLSVTVNPSPAAAVSANAPVVVQGTSGQLFVTVKNTGNTNLVNVPYTLSATLNNGAETITPSEATSGTVTVNYISPSVPGQTMLAFTFNVPSNKPAGTYSGTFQLTVGGSLLTQPVSVVVNNVNPSVVLPAVQFDQSEREMTVSKPFNLVNNGGVALTGITLTSSVANTTFSGVPATLAPGAVATVTVNSYVPKKQDSGVKQVGVMTFTSTQVTATAPLKMNAVSNLRFDKVQVAVGDGSFDTVSASGDSVSDDAKPHDKFQTKVILENLFSSGSKTSIEDVKIDAVFKGVGEDGDDVDGESDEFDIDEDDKSDAVMIDWDEDVINNAAANGDHEMVLTAEGTDENGARHSATFTVKVNVDRENGVDATLTKLSVSPASVDCGESFVLSVDGENLGEKSDKHAALELVNSALGISVKKEFKLGDYQDDNCDAVEKPDKSCREFSYDQSFMVPSSASSGTYAIKARFLYDTTKEGDSKTVDVTVVCDKSTSSTTTSGSGSSGSATSTTSAPSKPATTAQGSGTTALSSTGTKASNVEVLFSGPQASAPSAVAAAREPTKLTDLSMQKSFTDSRAFLMLLALANLAMVAIIMGLIARVMRK